MENKHHFYTNKLFSRYNRIVAISYLGIIIAAILLFHGEFTELKEQRVRSFQEAVARRASMLERNISYIENAARGVRTYGERYLLMDQKLQIPSPLYRHLSLSEDKKYFHLDAPGKDFDYMMIGNMTGVTLPPWRSRETREEIRMALNLNAYFQVVYRTMEETFSHNSLSICYTSQKGFRHSYPWVHSSKKRFFPSTLEKSYFTRGLPENNPDRSPYWSDVYFKSQSGNFTLNHSIPLYNHDRFMGIASVDITTQPFTEFLDQQHFNSGSFFLVTNDQQLIAVSSKGDQILNIGMPLFPPSLQGPLTTILDRHKANFGTGNKKRHAVVTKNGYLIASSALRNAPWTLLYVFPNHLVSDGAHKTGNHITFIILSLSLLLIIIHLLIRKEFITPARQLAHHIEKESRGQSDELTKLTQEAWLPWFQAITNVFSENSRLIHDLENHIESLDGTVQDRTRKLGLKNRQLQKAMDNLKIAQEQIILQEKLASLGSLTAGISHEIKNPLNFIINFSEVSQEIIEEIRQSTPKKGHMADVLQLLESNLRFINEHGHRADNIIRSMLMHSRQHEGEKIPTKINTLLSESASLAISGLKGQERIHSIHITQQFDDNLPMVEIIPEDVGRVFLNMINNSCYALLEKSQNQTPGTLAIMLSTAVDKEKKCIVIQVRDNGTGIPKKLLRKIFDPFYTTKPMGKGTGLGLSLSYDIIVQQNNGTFSVESKEGVYTCFTITFPMMK